MLDRDDPRRNVRDTDPDTSRQAAEETMGSNQRLERTALMWFYEHDRADGWTAAEFDEATPEGFGGVSFWRRLSTLRQEGWTVQVGTRMGPLGQPQIASRITAKGCEELGLPRLEGLPEPFVARRITRTIKIKEPIQLVEGDEVEYFTREYFADELEALDSPLCDCLREESPPTNWVTQAVLVHHCDCRAVEASRVIRKGESRTLHERECRC